MKKFFCSLVLFFATPFTFAMDVEFGGQHRARGIYYQQDINDIFIQRFKFSGAFRPNEMFESHFWLMTNYKWGDDYLVNGVRVYGYGDWKVSDELMLRLGRAPYQIADGSVISMNDYEIYPYAMDGVFLSYNTESLAVDLWGAYLPPIQIGQNELDDQYEGMVGLSVDVRSLPEEFKMANLYGMYVLSDNEENEHIRLGISINGDISGIDYSLTGVIHGKEVNEIIDQYAFDGQLGYTLDFDARIYIGGHYESEQYNSFYYDRHSRSGLSDVAQWGNGTVYAEGGISYMPSEDFEVGIVGLYFHSIGTWGVWGNAGYHPEDNAQLNKEQVIEVDVYVKKSYAGGFSAKVQGGVFDLSAEKPYWQVQLNTTFDF